MKIKVITCLISSVFLFSLIPSVGNAEDTKTFSNIAFYLSPKAGFGGFNISGKNMNKGGFGFSGMGALGMQMKLYNNFNMRGEFEYGYSVYQREIYQSEIIFQKRKFESKTYLLNLYTNFRDAKIIKPYIGFGLGLADYNASYDYSYRNNNFPDGRPPYIGSDKIGSASKKFALGIHLGTSFKIIEKVHADIGVRYFTWYIGTDLSPVTSIDFAHKLDGIVGIRFIF